MLVERNRATAGSVDRFKEGVYDPHINASRLKKVFIMIVPVIMLPNIAE